MAKDDVMADLPVTPAAPATNTDDGSVTVPRDLLESLSRQLEELKSNQNILMGQRSGEEVSIPGVPRAVSDDKKVFRQSFKRWQEDSTSKWNYVVDVKHLKFFVDPEKHERVNLFKVTSIDAEGNITSKDMMDTEFSKLGKPVTLKVTDRKMKEQEVQDEISPTIDAVAYQDSPDRNSVTGVRVVPLGKVQNLIRFKTLEYTVHIPADDAPNPLEAPSKITYKVIENERGVGGVRWIPESVTRS